MASILILLASIFSIAAAYRVWYAIQGFNYQTPRQPLDARQNRMLVILPSDSNPEKMLETAQSAVVQYYPKSAYDIVVIAPHFEASVLVHFSELPITTLDYIGEYDTRKAIQQAVDRSSTEYNAVVLLEEGVLLSPTFLQRINDRINDGDQAIQVQTKPKKWDAPLATLLGIADIVDMHILNKGRNAVGLSAQLMGGGIAFDYTIFKSLFPQILGSQFIETLDFLLAQYKIPVVYDDAAIVYLEKEGNQKHKPFFDTRVKLFQDALFSEKKTVKDFKNLGWNFYDKLLSALAPSKFLLFLALTCGTLFSPVAKSIWAVGLILFMLGFCLSTPFAFWKNGRLLKSILYLPSILFKASKTNVQIPAKTQVLHTETPSLISKN